MFWVVKVTSGLASLTFIKKDETFYSGLKPRVLASNLDSVRSPDQEMKLIWGLQIKRDGSSLADRLMRDTQYIRLGDSTVGQCHAWPPHGHPGWPWSQSAALWTLLTSGSLGLGFLSVASGSSIRGGVTEFQCPGVLVGRDIPAQVVPLGPWHSGFPWSLFTLQSDHLSHAVSLGAGGRWREGTGPGSCHIVRQF